MTMGMYPDRCATCGCYDCSCPNEPVCQRCEHPNGGPYESANCDPGETLCLSCGLVFTVGDKNPYQKKCSECGRFEKYCKCNKHPASTPLATQVGGDHYKDMAIQPIQFILANNLGYIEGCVIKYVCRYKAKGTPVQDLQKAKHYLDLLIQHLEGSDASATKT